LLPAIHLLGSGAFSIQGQIRPNGSG
jgi:hypothetical protein